MKNTDEIVKSAEELAKQIRLDSVEMTKSAGAAGGHIGPALSCADIVAVLYDSVMKYKKDDPEWPNRDRIILGKGHAVQTLYSALMRKGFISKDDMFTFQRERSSLPGHPPAHGVSGIDFPSGSMGHGFPVGAGMALGEKLKESGANVYVIAGDGEMNEGSMWEAAAFSAKYGLDNLTVIVDLNGLQHDGKTSEIMPMPNMAERFRSFGWETLEIDGHDVKAIYCALAAPRKRGVPRAVIANTIKGKGVSFMENDVKWHHSQITEEEYTTAVNEIKGGFCK